jgi:L-iditol 2-dehydrogenase
VTVDTRSLPAPGPGEVILKLESIGLCSSDFHIWRGAKPGKAGILGHEGAGEVVAAGPDAGGWRPGDFAVVNPLLNCGTCPDCLAGRGHICDRREIIGYNGAGLIADFQLVAARSLMKAPPGLSRRHGCLVEPLACVVHAQRRLSHVPATLLVLGAGPMGVMHAAYAKHAGVGRVWLADPREDKLALARKRGVPADAFMPLADTRQQVQQLTDDRGAAAVVTANSSRLGHELAFELTADAGELLAFASIIDRPGPIAGCDADGIHRREDRVPVTTDRGTITIVGAIGFDADSFTAAADLLATALDGEQFVTARAGLADVPGLVAGGWDDQLKIALHPHEAAAVAS